MLTKRRCQAVTRTRRRPAGHHVMALEGGWAHTEGDLTAGLLIEGDALALHPPAPPVHDVPSDAGDVSAG